MTTDPAGESPFALRSWFDRLAEEVLQEENFGGSNKCDFCREHYGKDTRRTEVHDNK